MEQCLVAAGERRTNPLALGRCSPIRGCRNGAMMRGKADQYCIVTVFLTCELAYIELGALTHIGRACIAEMRIMFPNGNLRAAVTPTEMHDQRIERLGHVAVAQIPGRYFLEKH